MRVAAVGDVHLAADVAGTLRPKLSRLAEQADVLLLAGDLTRCGSREEADVVVAELADLAVPVVAVLGNHDLHGDAEDEVRATLEASGITVLEGESTVLDVDGGRLGVAGATGFGGGFPGASCADFGEPEMRAFAARSRRSGEALERALTDLRADVTVALTHYAPVRGTLGGEPPELFPFLGSYHLAEAIDRGGADLAVHGHAHHGVEKGATPGGVPVRNVAQPVIRHAYHVYAVEERAALAG